MSIGQEDLDKMKLIHDLKSGKLKMQVKSALDAVADDDLRWLKMHDRIMSYLDTNKDGRLSFKEVFHGILSLCEWVAAKALSLFIGFGLGWLISYLIYTFLGVPI
jgi:hypothetical protein